MISKTLVQKILVPALPTLARCHRQHRSCLGSDSKRSKEWQGRGSCSSGCGSDGGGIGTSSWSGTCCVGSKANMPP